MNNVKGRDATQNSCQRHLNRTLTDAVHWEKGQCSHALCVALGMAPHTWPMHGKLTVTELLHQSVLADILLLKSLFCHYWCFLGFAQQQCIMITNEEK